MFLNPYDVSEKINFSELCAENFKKFSKQLLAELELEEEIEICQKKFSKSECLELIDKIQKNVESLKIYLVLYMRKNVNLLCYGTWNDNSLEELNIFLQSESRDAVSFASPYLSQNLKNIYRNAFLSNNRKILTNDYRFEPEYLETLYSATYIILKNQASELRGLKRTSLEKIKDTINRSAIENLPKYFDKVINDIIMAIRGISIEIHNKAHTNYQNDIVMLHNTIQVDAITSIENLEKKVYAYTSEIKTVKEILRFALFSNANQSAKNTIIKDLNDLNDIETEINNELQQVLKLLTQIRNNNIMAKSENDEDSLIPLGKNVKAQEAKYLKANEDTTAKKEPKEKKSFSRGILDSVSNLGKDIKDSFKSKSIDNNLANVKNSSSKELFKKIFTSLDNLYKKEKALGKNISPKYTSMSNVLKKILVADPQALAIFKAIASNESKVNEITQAIESGDVAQLSKALSSTTDIEINVEYIKDIIDKVVEESFAISNRPPDADSESSPEGNIFIAIIYSIFKFAVGFIILLALLAIINLISG